MVRRRGAILIMVLFVMVILRLVAVSFSYRAGLTRRLALERIMMLQLQHQARSAVAIAMARLKVRRSDFDHLAEPWHTHGPLSLEDWLPEWSANPGSQDVEYVTDYQVLDEEGKLSVLQASSEALKKLGMQENQVACLFDWMDADDDVRAEGAESKYYESTSQPYQCKNAPLELLEELLRIRGFSTADYYGPDANHVRQVDLSDNAPQAGWLDLLTCVGDGKINLNTAPTAVLRTLPISDQAVAQIVGYRHFDENTSGDLESHVFRSTEDIQQLQGLLASERDVLQAVGKFTSEYYRIFVCSRHLRTGLEYRLEVLVKSVPGAKLEILEWKVGS